MNVDQRIDYLGRELDKVKHGIGPAYRSMLPHQRIDLQLEAIEKLERKVEELQNLYLDKNGQELRQERFGAWISGFLREIPLSQLLDEIKRRYNDVDG